jgi:hypothetical protein
MTEAVITRTEKSARLHSFFSRPDESEVAPGVGRISSSTDSLSAGIMSGLLRFSAFLIETDGFIPVSGNQAGSEPSNSSVSAILRAPVGQAVTQAGSMPSVVLSAQKWHFSMYPRDGLIFGASYGQRQVQYPHPMHLSW